MIRGTDGLDYENLTEKLLGNPAKTERNWFIQQLSTNKIYSLPFILSRADFYEERGHFHATARARIAAERAGKSALSGRRAHAAVVLDEHGPATGAST